MKKNHHIAPEVKEQILRRIKDEGVPVSQAAKEHGVSEATNYDGLGRAVKSAPSLGELARLKRQNEELLALVGEHNRFLKARVGQILLDMDIGLSSNQGTGSASTF